MPALYLHLYPIQDAIDAVLFRCYGLTEDDGRYIARRLGEMV